MIDLVDFLKFEDFKGDKDLCFAKIETDIEECIGLFPIQKAPLSKQMELLPVGSGVYASEHGVGYIKEYFISTASKVVEQYKGFYIFDFDVTSEEMKEFVYEEFDIELDDLEWHAIDKVVENSYAD